MPLLTMILVLAIVGLVTWAVITYIPMPPAIRTLIVAFVVVACVLWLLQIIGFVGPTVPRMR